MNKYYNEIWNSLPPWAWSKILIVIGLIIIFISLNSWARSSRNKRK